MTSVPDHSGKLISQVADDATLTHTPTRKRDDKEAWRTPPAETHLAPSAGTTSTNGR
jgi:hypothetical protein